MPSALALLLLLAGAPSAGQRQTYSCEYEVPRRGTSGSASVEVEGGVVQKVTVNDFYQGLPGNMGYSCMLEPARDDQETKWTDIEGGVEIEFADAGAWGDGDTMTVKALRDGFSIDLTNTKSSGKCGAGAELPQTLTILKSSKKCRVVLSPLASLPTSIPAKVTAMTRHPSSRPDPSVASPASRR